MTLSQEQLGREWIQHKVYKDPDSRSLLINHYSYLVKITAGRLVTSIPNGMDKDDLVSAGVIGLIKSVDQFDPTREVKFETYAIALIRGAILEMMREEDWVPRSIREKLKIVDRAQTALETELGRPPSEREIGERTGLTDEEVSQILVYMGRTGVYSLDDLVGGHDGEDSMSFVEMVVDHNASPTGEVEGKELRKMLAESVDGLPERERLVISLYYFEGLTFKEIGRVLTVSESRVYQLHSQAMNRMRGMLRERASARIA